ncbi:MAG: methyltransferase domain-containing protein [Deltaproteobacteria bacterium]|nr:methyltransferase domain-containing protein [Deltaproteobacteria bacterium]
MRQKWTPPGGEADPARTDYQFLEDLATAYWYSEVLFAALELDLFAALPPGGATVPELAQERSWDADALGRLLTALAGLGLLVEHQGRYANGPLANRYLLPGSPDFLGDFLAYRRFFAPRWTRLPQRVRQGVAANQRGGPADEASYAERVLAYVRALDAQARQKAAEAARHLPHLLPTPPRRILDLGGGAGAWCRALVGLWPAARATLLDMPEVLEAARALYPAPEAWQGVAAVAGDGRTPALAGPGFELIILSNFLHAYGREEAGEILCRAAGLLAPGGTVLIHDYLLEPAGSDPLKGRLYDLHMLLNTYNGRIHGLADLEQMLAGSGLAPWRTLHLGSDSSLVLARAAAEYQGDWQEPDLWLAWARDLGFRQAKIIDPREVALAPWVREKCGFGCRGFGQGLQCPPHSPDEEKMARILASYHQGLLLEGQPPGQDFHAGLLSLERRLFLAGQVRALAFGAGPCTLCPTCDPTRPCRRPAEARPALEACGVDVYETARRAGWRLAPLVEPTSYVKYLGLVLID